MSSYNFGEELADARRRAGLSVQQVSDALRIRPDIIRALEMEDFARMPAKGFARNQVSAYARYLGLDSVEFTDRFLAAYNEFERSAANIGYVVDHQQPSGGDRAYATARRARNNQESERQHRSRPRPSRGGGSRREPAPQRRARNNARSSDRARYATPRRGGRSARSGDRNIGSRGFNPAGSRFPQNRLIMIIAAIVILILIIFGISRCAGGSSDSSSTQQATQTSENTVQVTGGQESGTVMQDQDANALTTMPDIKSVLTQFETTVSIPAGSQASIQVDVDGSNVAYDTYSGPWEQKFTVKEAINVITWSPDSVKVTVNGTDYSFKNADDDTSAVKLKLVEGKVVQE